MLLTGFAYSSRTAADGARGVLALHMDGDPLSLAGCARTAVHGDVQALTSVSYAAIPQAALFDLASRNPAVADAMWQLTAENAATLSEWLLSVGRRDARGRIAHLICEIAARQNPGGADAHADYLMPLTQQQLGDSTGLTPVHVNRVLQGLRRDRLIRCVRG